jgi:aspartyl-tRNA(Asn)/glutamyl-tRNA(Gln) amidotransferase subunit A
MSDVALTIDDAAAKIREGETTSLALTERALAMADALDAQLGVYLTRFDEYALERAAAADRELAAGIDRGPLHGMPIGIKDFIAVAEGPTTAQSLVLDEKWGEARDAVVVERLKAAGSVITGKLTMMEFGLGAPDQEKPFPIPRNPWNPDRWAGGSSSGSGSAVAAGLVLAAIGTDTAGSVRGPAACCGVSGLLPTFGRVPNAGCAPIGYSLDRIGPLARSVWDCGAMLSAIAGPDERDPYAADEPVPAFLAAHDGSLAGLRIGVERANHFGVMEEDPAVAPAFEAALAVLESLGAHLVEVEIPNYAEACTAILVTLLSEAFAYHGEDLREHWDDYLSSTRLTIGAGALISGADYVQAQRVRRVAQRGLAGLFDEVDLIAMPAAAKPAPTLEALYRDPVGAPKESLHLMYWNAVGNPALALPMGFTADDLPLSLQVAGRPFEEALVIRCGDAFQAATDWHLRVPSLLANLPAGGNSGSAR